MTPHEQSVSLSLLDRLAEPEGRSSPWEDLRQFKASLCRDLAGVLNTRRTEHDFPAEYEQCKNSLLNYGVVDFTSYNLTNAIEQEQLRRSMERAIRQFEPRLSRVTVHVEAPDPLKPVLKFQISAILRAELIPEEVLFDVTVHRDSRKVAVTGANG
jgi:type VI secretion system protein ImpF